MADREDAPARVDTAALRHRAAHSDSGVDRTMMFAAADALDRQAAEIACLQRGYDDANDTYVLEQQMRQEADERATAAEAERDEFRGCLATTAGKLMAAEAALAAERARADRLVKLSGILIAALDQPFRYPGEIERAIQPLRAALADASAPAAAADGAVRTWMNAASKWQERATAAETALAAERARADRLAEALRSAETWHREQRKALSKQPPNGAREWAMQEHREQADVCAAALAHPGDASAAAADGAVREAERAVIEAAKSAFRPGAGMDDMGRLALAVSELHQGE